MTENQIPQPADVGEMYDQVTEQFMRALGDNVHFGFWHDDKDDTPVQEATDRLTDIVADRLALSTGTEVLDIGCGTGRSTVRIAARHQANITAITVSPHELELAQAYAATGPHAGQATFRLADAMALPFPDGCFGAAYAIESLVHMPDRAKAVAEIARTLRPGGRLVITDIHRHGDIDQQEADRMAAVARLVQLPPFDSTEHYEQNIAAAGLDLVDFEDLSDNVHRSTSLVAESLRQAAKEPGLDPGTRAHLHDVVSAVETLTGHPNLRYSLITARRP
ncbi:methyltransferase domain-containing protein [Streptomyces sp. QTS52]